MDCLLRNRLVRALRGCSARCRAGHLLPGERQSSKSCGGLVQSRRITSAILALASLTFIAACDDDDDPIGTGNDNTTVRFFNVASGGLNLDIAENGTVGT